MGEKKEILTDCTLCYHSCGARVTVEDGKATKIRGLESHPINKGRLCPKGANALEVIYSPDRLKQPLKRINGRFEKISWDRALDEIAEKLNRLKEAKSLLEQRLKREIDSKQVKLDMPRCLKQLFGKAKRHI